MALSNTQIQQLYTAYLGRPVDQEGIDYWGRDGITIEDLRFNLANDNQPEYVELYGDRDRGELVTAIYQNMFGREPDDVGFTYWTEGEGASVPASELQELFITAASAEDRAAFDAQVAQDLETFNEQPDPGVPGETFTLTPDGDNLEGTADNDTFEAPIGTISFANGNTLNSGDSLDGNGGNNTLEAELINDGFFQSGLGAVRPSTENVQNVIVNAIETTGGETVTLNAANMYDVENVWSRDSNANLVIQDITTKTSDGGARNTEELTFRMDHTSNANTSGTASDLTVYFDENYLLAGQQTTSSQASYFLLDQDGEQFTDTPLLNIDRDGVRFTLDGEAYSVRPADQAALEANTWEGYADALRAEIDRMIEEDGAERLSSIEVRVDENQTRQTFNDAGQQVTIPAIVLEDTAGGEFSELGYTIPEGLSDDFNVYGRFTTDPSEMLDDQVATNLELFKAGRGSEGGDALIGGKSQSESSAGIPIINVSVLGADDKPSNVGFIGTTNEDLDQVNIETNADYVDGESYASLEIRDGFGTREGGQQTELVSSVNADDFLGDLAIGTDTAVTNVAEFSATGGGDISYFADFDTGLTHSVTTGEGNDVVSVNTNGAFTAVDISISGGDNQVFVGGATPTGTVETGNGDDLIMVASDGGTAEGNNLASWTADGASAGEPGDPGEPALPQITSIDLTGTASEDGDVSVSIVDGPTLTFTGAVTDGDNAADITAPEESDAGYSAEITDGVITVTGPDGEDFTVDTVTLAAGLDNDAPVEQQAADEGVAPTDPVDPTPAGSAEFDFFGASTQVTFNGVESEWVEIDSTDYRTSAAQINAAIISAVGGTKALADVLEVDTLPGDALELNSLISGSNSLEVDIRGPVALGDGANWDLSTGSDQWKPYLTEVTETQLTEAWNTYFPESDEVEGSSGPNAFLAAIQDAATASNDRYEFADQGTPSSQVSSVVINAGGGEDTIALSSNLESADTVVFEGGFGETTIYNFNGGDAGGNDALDFTSYLDTDAPGRASSVDADTRSEEQVDFSFNNGLAGDTFAGDHNETALLSFDDLVNAYVDSLNNGVFADDAVSFADFGASELEAALNESVNVVEGGNDTSAIGNQFVILVGKDGEVVADADGDLAFNTDYATSEFKAFNGQVISDGDGGYAYQVDGEAGLVDLAGVDLENLVAADFNIA